MLAKNKLSAMSRFRGRTEHTDFSAKGRTYYFLATHKIHTAF